MGRAIFNRTNIGVVSKALLGKNVWDMGWNAYGHSWAYRNHQEVNWTETCMSLCLLTWRISYYNNNEYVFNVLNPYDTCVKLKVLYMHVSSKMKFMVGCSFFRCLRGTGWWFRIVQRPTAVACSTWPWITATTWRRWTWRSLWQRAVEDWLSSTTTNRRCCHRPNLAVALSAVVFRRYKQRVPRQTWLLL